MTDKRLVHIVDDEDGVRRSASFMLKTSGFAVQTWPSGIAFLKEARHVEPGCVLLDVRMPDMNGVAVFDQLIGRGLLPRLPVIFLTGHGDVPMAVDSLKRGAFDFFEKPFNDNQLMDRVDQALAASRAAAASDQVRMRLATLSAREREVLDLILAGKMNKVVADELGISMRTVEVHRAHIFDKMQVKTAVELAGLLK